MAKAPLSIRPPLQADPSVTSPCRVAPCPGPPARTPLTRKKEITTQSRVTTRRTLALPLPLTLALTLALTLTLLLPGHRNEALVGV